VDRTILPGIPAGEDADAVVGVVDLLKVGRNNIRVRIRDSRHSPGSTRKAGPRGKVVPEDRIGGPAAGREGVPAGEPTVRSSAALAR
jgi:hypothetical protein